MADQLSPNQVLALRGLSQQLATAKHGGKVALKQVLMQQFSWSLTTLHRNLELTGHTTNRKTRCDKGSSCVSRQDVLMMASATYAATRNNGRQIMGLEDAADMLRANKLIKAQRVDKSTGEIKPVLPQTLARQMKVNGMHPSQLSAPAPHVQLSYKHPNYTWQVDASVCVIYYMEQKGTCLLDETKYYKNKPNHVESIASKRVIRYVMYDCFSGTLLTRYYLGAETTVNLMDFFIWCTQQRSYRGADMPMYGVPTILADDAGSANGAHAFQSMLSALDVRHITHMPGNPRASGGVESGQRIVERKFESKLSFKTMPDLDALNAAAEKWMHTFNAMRVHSRHGHTRYGLWQTVREDQLRLAPSLEVMQSLPASKVETRVVDDELTISFSMGKLKSSRYDLRDVADIWVGAKVQVSINPYEQHAGVQCIRVRLPEIGDGAWTTCRALTYGLDGVRSDAPVFGEEFASLPDTKVDTARKQVLKTAYDSDTLIQAKRNKFGRKAAFGGAINPFAIEDAAVLPFYMNKHGTENSTLATPVGSVYLSLSEACMFIKGAMQGRGATYEPSTYAYLQARYTDGRVPQEAAEALAYNDNAQQATGTHDAEPEATGFTGLRSVK